MAEMQNEPNLPRQAGRDYYCTRNSFVRRGKAPKLVVDNDKVPTESAQNRRNFVLE